MINKVIKIFHYKLTASFFLLNKTNHALSLENTAAVWTSGLERRDCDQHGVGSKHTRAILRCPWERHFTVLSSAVQSSEAVIHFIHNNKTAK